LSVFFALFVTDEISFIRACFQDSLLGLSANNCFTSNKELIANLNPQPEGRVLFLV